MRNWSGLLGLFIALLALTGCQEELQPPSAPAASAGNNGLALALAHDHGGPQVIPPHARPHGKSYGKWSEL